MTDDRMDQRLREAGSRWRAENPPYEMALRDPRRRPDWLLVSVAAAAAVILVVLASVALTHRAAGIATPGFAPGVVPWKPLAATHPVLPQHRVPASPAPAPTSMRSCRAQDIKLSRLPSGGAGGTQYINVGMRLVGSTPCRLGGRPEITPLGTGGVANVLTSSMPSLRGDWHGPVALRAGKPAYFAVAWAVSHYCGAVDVTALGIRLPGIASPFTVAGFGPTTCNPGEGHPPIEVGPITPAHITPAHTTSPYADLRARAHLNRIVPAGKPVRFTVTLLSRHDLVLDPCPDYTITEVSGKVPITRRYALNCAGLSSKDSHGVPTLPAKTPVTFDMQAPAMKPGTQKFIWQLESPGHVSAGRTLTVR